MANNPASNKPAQPRKDTTLTAEELNRIVDMLLRRITGGKGISVRSFSGRLIIEESDT